MAHAAKTDAKLSDESGKLRYVTKYGGDYTVTVSSVRQFIQTWENKQDLTALVRFVEVDRNWNNDDIKAFGVTAVDSTDVKYVVRYHDNKASNNPRNEKGSTRYVLKPGSIFCGTIFVRDKAAPNQSNVYIQETNKQYFNAGYVAVESGKSGN